MTDLGFEEAFGLKDAEAAAEAEPTPEVKEAPPEKVEQAPQGDPAIEPETGNTEDQAQEGKQGHMVPLNVLLEQREKRQAAERLAQERDKELETLRRQLEQVRTPPQPQTMPDPVDDLQGFLAYQANQEWQSRAYASELAARQKYGAEFDPAFQWAQKRAQEDPLFGPSMRNQFDPADWVYKQYKRDQILSEMGDDPDAWARKRAAELGTVADQTGGHVPPVPQQAPPRSLAGAPSTGAGHQTIPDGSAFNAIRFGLD